MTANKSRRDAAEWAEGAQLFERTTRDLPTGRHQFHKERLMAQIQQSQQEERTPAARRFWLARPSIALPALTVFVAGAIVAGVVITRGGGPAGGGVATGPALTTQLGSASSDGVPQLLNQIALAAVKVDQPIAKPGQYIYIESETADTFVQVVDDKSSLASHELHRRQLWKSLDGTKGWLIDPAVDDSPDGETLSLPDEQGNTPQAYLNNPSYDYLAKLTTDPGALLAKIYQETKGHGTSADQEAFTTIGDLLGQSYPPAALYSALFKAAALIPGVVVVDDAVDAAGRHGVAVARLDATSGQRQEWIFDKQTNVFLGERTVQVNQPSGENVLIKPGTVLFTSAILNRAVVDDIKQTPHAG